MHEFTMPPIVDCNNEPAIKIKAIGQDSCPLTEPHLRTLERPLVTFALFAYNQDKYIREAVEAAFAQTYEPLEIILSDDCSIDHTFEIICDMAAKYEGPHKIQINQNKKNLGISSHVRYIHEISTGELIVHAAGDDISHSNRTTAIVSAFDDWAQNPPSMIISNARVINEEGVVDRLLCINMPLQIRKKEKNPLMSKLPMNGCTVAIHRHVIDCFNAPINGIIAEDHVLQIRAHLLSGILYIPDVLLDYRVHNACASRIYDENASLYIKKDIEWSSDILKRMQQARIDIAHAVPEANAAWIQSIEKYEYYYNLKIQILASRFTGSVKLTIKSLLTKKLARDEKRTILNRFITKWFPFIWHTKRYVMKPFIQSNHCRGTE